MDISKMTGLEVLEAISGGTIEQPGMGKTIGVTRTEFHDGRAVFYAKANENHLNPMRGVHGGFAATLLDSATGCAIHTKLAAGYGYGTVDLNVKMLRPVPVGEEVICEAVLTHLSKSLGVSEGTLKDQNGRLLASGSATCFIIPPKS